MGWRRVDRQPEAARKLRVRCSAGGPNLQKPGFLGGGLCPHFHADTPVPFALKLTARHLLADCGTARCCAAQQGPPRAALGRLEGCGIPAKGCALSRERLGILSIIMLQTQHVPHPSSPLSPRHSRKPHLPSQELPQRQTSFPSVRKRERRRERWRGVRGLKQ